VTKKRMSAKGERDNAPSVRGYAFVTQKHLWGLKPSEGGDERKKEVVDRNQRFLEKEGEAVN